MPVVPKKRQILIVAASKSWQTDHTAHQASEALEKGGVYASIMIGSGPIWEISAQLLETVAQPDAARPNHVVANIYD